MVAACLAVGDEERVCTLTDVVYTVLKEIEEEKRLFTPKKGRIAAKRAAEAERAVEEQQQEEPVAGDDGENTATNDGQAKVEVVNGAKFF